MAASNAPDGAGWKHGLQPLSNDEEQFLSHMLMFGVEGFPVRRVWRSWIWEEAFGVRGTPTVYKTKKEAVAAISRFLKTLVERKAANR